MTDLKDLDGIPDPSLLAQTMNELNTRADAMTTAFADVNQSAAAANAHREAHRVMVYPRRVFEELTHEANLIAVSPLFVFDAARLGQRGGRRGDVRYALGGGMRLSVVSLDVAAGYAMNPNRKPWEPRGAVVFSMAVSHLFR
ncbi:MAG: hypothetical protein ABR555_18170 [Pyrinomonadaceae bacterium]